LPKSGAFWDLGPSKMSFPSRRRAKIRIFARFTLFSENARKSLQNSLNFASILTSKAVQNDSKKGSKKQLVFKHRFRAFLDPFVTHFGTLGAHF